MGHFRPLFIFYSFQYSWLVVHINFANDCISGVGSDRSTNRATTTTLKYKLFANIAHCLKSSNLSL